MILLPQQVVYVGFYCSPKKLQIEISAKRKKYNRNVLQIYWHIKNVYINLFCWCYIGVGISKTVQLFILYPTSFL